jgi:hypothetical protein
MPMIRHARPRSTPRSSTGRSSNGPAWTTGSLPLVPTTVRASTAVIAYVCTVDVDNLDASVAAAVQHGGPLNPIPTTRSTHPSHQQEHSCTVPCVRLSPLRQSC